MRVGGGGVSPEVITPKSTSEGVRERIFLGFGVWRWREGL